MAEALAAIELMIQDQSVGTTGTEMIERKRLTIDDDTRDRFLDGPATRRVAIVDFDPATGAALPAPATFTAAKPSTPARGGYDTNGLPRESPQFLAVNAFGTVFETIRMFEEPEALGRRVTWAFDGEQLLVVPRAGKMANAYYERATRSLQFFWFDSPIGPVHTALSRDIVAHECGHALLDAVVPGLHDSSTPQSIAIHEAVADLVAVLMALRSRPLRMHVLATNDNSISDATAFSSIAERFGMARPRPDDPHPHALRDLRNDHTISTVDQRKPHVLSTILSAIFYESLIDMFELSKRRATPRKPTVAQRAAGANKALGSAAYVFRRLLLRGIDYLPPGELTFADVGRATLAADRAVRPDPTEGVDRGRGRFAERFVARGVVASVDELASDAPQELRVAPEKLPDIRDSDWAAYRYVHQHRTTIGIPRGVSFTVLPRVDANKKIGPQDKATGEAPMQRELILKVYWDVLERNRVAAVPARQRRIRTGATVALRWSDGAVLALVRSDVMAGHQRQARDLLLTELAQSGLVTLTTSDGGAEPSGVEVRLLGEVARVSGTQRLLHIEAFE